MTNKYSTVDYTPSIAGKTDTITAYWNKKSLASLDVYLNPTINVSWNLPVAYYTAESSSVTATLEIKGLDNTSIKAKDVKVVCSDGNQTFYEETANLKDGTTVSFDYTAKSTGPDSLYMTLSFTTVNDDDSTILDYEFKSDSVPVIKDGGDYVLAVTSIPVIVDTINGLTLVSQDTSIPTGETINFKSTNGINVSGTWEDA